MSEHYPGLFIKIQKSLGKNVSKNSFSSSHLNFSANMGEISDEHGELFHQEIKERENRYKGRITKQCRSTPTSGPPQSKRKSPCSQVISL